MKLAKKTLSVALAAVMAASSLAGTVSAFAIEPIQVTPSAVKYTALVNGQATVKPNVTINNDFAKEAATLDEEGKTANFNAQIDKTSLSSYYSFTPAKTGYYNMHVESAPVFYGYSQDIYSKYKKAGYGAADAIKYAHVYQSTPDGLFSAYTEVKEGEKLTDVTFDKTKALKDENAEDSVTIDNVYTAVDEEKTERDPFVVYDVKDGKEVAPKAESKFDTKDETGFVLSYKYTKFNGQDYIIPDKHDPRQSKGRGVSLVNNGLLQAGKTYYFKATLKQSHVVVREENKNPKKDDKIYNYAVKSTAAPSAKISISRSQGLNYYTNYTLTTDEKDYQVLACPAGTSITLEEPTHKTYTADYDVKYGKSVVKLPVYKTSAVANYYGDALKVTVADTYQNNKVEEFTNYFGGLQSVSLGKNVKTIGTVKVGNDWVPSLSTKAAPQLKSIEIKNPEFVDFAGLGVDADKVTFTVPANTAAWYAAVTAGYKVNVTCAHKWVVTKAATIFATGTKKCSECDAVATVAKVRFAPTAKASKKKIVVKGNAGKVAKLAVWVYNSNGKLVKKQVKKNVTKNTVKVAKAGKYTVKVKAYGPNGAKTASVKKTVKVK